MQDAPANVQTGSGAKKAIGRFIAGYAVLGDNVVGIFIILAAALTNPLVVWPVATAIVTAINFAFSTWLMREWPAFRAGSGAKLEKRVEGMREGRLMSRPIAWISEGSVRRFTLAAILTNAITAVVAARIVGAPVDRRRIFCAALGFSAVSCGLHTTFGALIGYAVRALN